MTKTILTVFFWDMVYVHRAKQDSCAWQNQQAVYSTSWWDLPMHYILISQLNFVLQRKINLREVIHLTQPVTYHMHSTRTTTKTENYSTLTQWNKKNQWHYCLSTYQSTASQKMRHFTFVHILTNYWLIFTDTLCRQFAIMWLSYIPPHRKCASTLPCEI